MAEGYEPIPIPIYKVTRAISTNPDGVGVLTVTSGRMPIFAYCNTDNYFVIIRKVNSTGSWGIILVDYQFHPVASVSTDITVIEIDS